MAPTILGDQGRAPRVRKDSTSRSTSEPEARGIDPLRAHRLVERHLDGRHIDTPGERRSNVLRLSLALARAS